jgi:hypothetical protein
MSNSFGCTLRSNFMVSWSILRPKTSIGSRCFVAVDRRKAASWGMSGEVWGMDVDDF